MSKGDWRTIAISALQKIYYTIAANKSGDRSPGGGGGRPTSIFLRSQAIIIDDVTNMRERIVFCEQKQRSMAILAPEDSEINVSRDHRVGGTNWSSVSARALSYHRRSIAVIYVGA